MAKSQDAFRTISEVADWLETPAHVLRFWESRFTQVKPVKRAGGRRYYRPADMELLSGIKKLLHEDGLTIKGVQKLLRAEGIKHVAAMGQTLDDLGNEVSDAPEMTPREIVEAAQGAPAMTAETEADTATSQVISFPSPTENPEANEPALQEPEPTEVSTESDPEPPQEVAPPQDPPRQASFLDDIPEANLFTPNVETPSEPISETADEPEIAPTEADQQIAAQAPPSEERALEFIPHDEAVSEVDISINVAQDESIAEETGVDVEEQELESTEERPVETVDEITSLSQLVLPDPSEIPEVQSGFSSATPESDEEAVVAPSDSSLATEAPSPQENPDALATEPSEITDQIEEYDLHQEHSSEPSEEDLKNLAALDGLSEVPSVEQEATTVETTVDTPAKEPAQLSPPADYAEEPASDEPIYSETALPPQEIEAVETVVAELEDEPIEEAIPGPTQDIEFVLDSTLEPKSTAPEPVEIEVEALAGAAESSLEPEVEALEESEDVSRVNVTTNGAPEPIAETTAEVAPVIEEGEATPPEETPAQVVTPIQAETPADPSDDTPDFSGPTTRERLTRRAAPFSPDKKSELVELTTRLAALRKTYGTVSKPSSKN